MPGVAEARLQAAAHGARDVVAGDGRVAVVQDARDGAGLLAVGAREAREERVERVAARVLDGHRAQRRADVGVDVGQRVVADSVGSALLTVGVFSDAGSACSPVAGAAVCAAWRRGAARRRRRRGDPTARATTRSARSRGVA